MQLPRIQLAMALFAASCGAPPRAQPASAPAPSIEPPSIPPQVGGAAPAPAPSAAPQTSAELVLPPGGSGRFLDLDVTLVELVEKRTMDGSGMMRVTLRLRAQGKDETVEITSDEPSLSWNGFVLEYRGGWRQEARLTVRRAPP